MGDRTNVEIEVRKIDYEWLLRAEFKDDEKAFCEAVGANEINIHEDRVFIMADEVNYAEWEDLENLLYDYSIEFDKSWGPGGNYSRGNGYWRIVNGEMMALEIYEGAEAEISFMRDIKDLSAEEIQRRVLDRYAFLVPFEAVPLAA